MVVLGGGVETVERGTPVIRGGRLLEARSRLYPSTLRGFLEFKDTHYPLGGPYVPRYRPTVGS